jgi:asparagine synthase (glutamine-hydrolysing)
VISAVLADSLTYLDREALDDLYERVEELEREQRPGIIVETGCALGGSAIVLASAKRAARPLCVYDVFGMIPPPSARDGADVHSRYAVIASGQSSGINGETYYGYKPDLYGEVTANFARHGLPLDRHSVSLIKGLYADTLHPEHPVALAHIDCDWYESVTTCLERIVPRLVVGGVLVIDDYHSWSGCKAAVDHYFATRQPDFEFVDRGRRQITRIG